MRKMKLPSFHNTHLGQRWDLAGEPGRTSIAVNGFAFFFFFFTSFRLTGGVHQRSRFYPREAALLLGLGLLKADLLACLLDSKLS